MSTDSPVTERNHLGAGDEDPPGRAEDHDSVSAGP